MIADINNSGWAKDLEADVALNLAKHYDEPNESESFSSLCAKQSEKDAKALPQESEEEAMLHIAKYIIDLLEGEAIDKADELNGMTKEYVIYLLTIQLSVIARYKLKESFTIEPCREERSAPRVL